MVSENGYDVAIIGGGPAGLAAAVALGRSLRRVVVIDAGEPRNAVSPGAHNVLGNEGVAPLALLAAGRREALGYGVEIRDDRVVGGRRDGDRFVLSVGERAEVEARVVVLAAGVRDELPAIDGLARFWGTSVLHCPYCHGWEVQGRRIGVIATGPNASHQAQLFRQVSDDVTVVLHDASLDEDTRRRMVARGIRIVDGPVTRVAERDGVLSGVVLEDGSELAFDALVVGPRSLPPADLVDQLGLTVEYNPMGGAVAADPFGRTAVPGVWVAGNAGNLGATVLASMAAGMGVGAQINAALVEEETDAALANT